MSTTAPAGNQNIDLSAVTANPLLSPELAARIKAMADAEQQLLRQAEAMWQEELLPLFQANQTPEILKALRQEISAAACDHEMQCRDLPAPISVGLMMLVADAKRNDAKRRPAP
ncbi:hypothetical protein [Paucibacter soli]|uniref:hypothetical protein n=1 Tax=Paucibacter soli TaxID=3133433 RepID=UPI0030AB115F